MAAGPLVGVLLALPTEVHLVVAPGLLVKVFLVAAEATALLVLEVLAVKTELWVKTRCTQ